MAELVAEVWKELKTAGLRGTGKLESSAPVLNVCNHIVETDGKILLTGPCWWVVIFTGNRGLNFHWIFFFECHSFSWMGERSDYDPGCSESLKPALVSANYCWRFNCFYFERWAYRIKWNRNRYQAAHQAWIPCFLRTWCICTVNNSLFWRDVRGRKVHWFEAVGVERWKLRSRIPLSSRS